MHVGKSRTRAPAREVRGGRVVTFAARGVAACILLLIAYAALSSSPFQLNATDALNARVERFGIASQLEASGLVDWHKTLRTAIESSLYGVLAMSLVLGTRLRWPSAVAIAIVIAVLSECTRLFHPARPFELHDIGTNSIGALIGGLIGAGASASARRS